jgi:cell division septum initiation protein DivIVA
MRDAEKLQKEIDELRQQVAYLRASDHALRAAFVILAQHLAEDKLVYIQDICADLDTICDTYPDKGWQNSLIALAEDLRNADDSL